MSAVLEKMNELPEGWVISPLSDCADILDSKRIPINSKERSARIDGKSQDELYPYYGATGQVGVIDGYIFEGEYLLIGEDGAPFFDKSKNVAYIAKGKFWVNNHAHILDAIEGVTSNKYLLHYLNKFNYKDYVGGTTRLKLNQADLKQIPVPLAPPEQQKRIVAKIEELFSHIDAGIEALKRTKQLLKQYRQSVLKAAVTGELTKEWREANKDKLEPASQLLDRILKERRQKWEEQQLELFKAKGKMPKDDKWKEKYKEPELPKAEKIESIPDAWLYCGIEMLLLPDKAAMKTGPFGSLLKKHEHKNEGVPVLGIENIASMQFVPGSKIHITEKKAKELDGYKVEEGDILISRSGTVGEVCVVPDIGEARISTNLMKLSLVKGGLDPVYFTYLFNGSPFVLGQVSELCKGSTRDFLNQDILKKLLLVLPPHQEQLEIIEIVEERFRKIERLGKEIDIQILKAEKNKQSVLSHSFSGKIVA